MTKPSSDAESFAFGPSGAGYGTASATTDVTGALAIGATSIPVLSSAGFAATDAIVVEPGMNEEVTTVSAVPDGTHLTVPALSKAHASGVEIRKTPNTGGKLAAAF